MGTRGTPRPRPKCKSRRIMNQLKLLKKFTEKDIKEIAIAIHKHFNLASSERIFDLILQVDSIETALHLLMCHKNSDMTLDNIVYQYLHWKDNKWFIGLSI